MRGLLLAMLLAAAPALTGCGSVFYTATAGAASSRLEEARLMGAETKAPFEYYTAREHLRQAQVEAAEASYGDAASYAETAELYAQKAIDSMRAGRARQREAALPGGPWSKPGTAK